VSADDALIRLGQSASEAISGVLEMFAPGKIAAGDVSVVTDDPMASLPLPAVATNVAYVDGVTGGNVFVMTLDGARKLAAAMMGMDKPEGGWNSFPELSELELSAVSEAMNQMMASAAIAISSVLGTDVEIGTPETRTFTEHAQALDAYPRTPHAVRASFTVCGEPCRLLQLVPNAFVVRMTTALDDLGSEVPSASAPGAASGASPAAAAPGGPSLAGIPVRVWAELGRAQMASAQVVGMPPGSVVELNQAADEPIDLYVNGTRFATGRLMVVDGTDWAVRIETVLSSSNTSTESQMEVARWPESW
jgi:flagellar motor switch protein FliN/FliY